MRVSRSYRAVLALSTALVLASWGSAFVAEAQETASDRERALVLFEAAELRYQEARFEEAVELLVEARELFDEAVISYNLGRAYEELRRWSDAAEAFRHYLTRSPDAEDRRLVESRIERLDSESASTTDAAVGVTPTPETADPVAASVDDPIETTRPPDTSDTTAASSDGSARGVSIGALLVASLGVAGVGVGMGLGVASQSSRDDAVSDPVHETSRQSFRDAENLATAANIAFVAGGALAALGLAWLFLDLALADDDRVALRVGPGSLAVAGRFP